MIKERFSVINIEKEIDDNGLCKVYGICANDTQTSCVVEDISTDVSFVNDLINTLISGDCSLLHFNDVVCDYIQKIS